ncbi:MAG: hypothetical protein D6800_05105, partial [Candidatus Zixiibacteriota bacterium]
APAAQQAALPDLAEACLAPAAQLFPPQANSGVAVYATNARAATAMVMVISFFTGSLLYGYLFGFGSFFGWGNEPSKRAFSDWFYPYYLIAVYAFNESGVTQVPSFRHLPHFF